MNTKTLDRKELTKLQPATLLWDQYNPDTAPYRFSAQTQTEAEQWHMPTRQALDAIVGFQSLPSVDLSPEKLEEVDKGDYVREKILLQTSAHTLMPVYLLIPKHAHEPLPVVIAFHGHGYGRISSGCGRTARSGVCLTATIKSSPLSCAGGGS